MRRFLPFAALAAVVLAGCSDTVPGGKKVVTPTPDTIIGKRPRPPVTVVGDPENGKKLFNSQGCAACHIFTPAGATTGKVGPNLDNLPAYAQKAGQPLREFTSTSITDPGAYIAPGYPAGVMPATYASLSKQDLADLVAFLTKSS